MKKLLFTLALLATSLSAGNKFNNSLIEEYLVKGKREIGEKRYNNEYNLIKNDTHFSKAKSTEKGAMSKSAGGKSFNMPDYEKVIEELYNSGKSSGSTLPYYVALEIGQHLWMMRNDSLNQKYLKEISRILYKHKYCRGYLQYGQFLWDDDKREQSLDVLKTGMNNCKDPYMQIAIKRAYYKHSYLEKERKNKQNKGHI